MADLNIDISVEVTGLDKLIKLMECYAKTKAKQQDRIIYMALMVGANTMQRHLVHAEYDGDKDALVYIRQYKTKGVVGIRGRDVLFIEFGTGVTHSGDKHEYSNKTGYQAGSYPGKGYWDYPKGWVYRGDKGTHGIVLRTDPLTGLEVVRTKGNPPNRVVYKTFKTMQRALPRIVERVMR